MDSDAEEAEVQRQIQHQKELVQRDARREKKRRAKAAQKARLRRGAGIVEESNVDDATLDSVAPDALVDFHTGRKRKPHWTRTPRKTKSKDK